jgi:hypothetical protein
MSREARAHPGERWYWAFAASPRIFDIENAVQTLDVDLWPTRGKDIRVGDRAIIWKYKAADPFRGVVALGEVISEPEIRPEHDRRFWVEPAQSELLEERVMVRYVLPTGVPLWLTTHPDDPLRSLSVSRAAGGSVFYVSDAAWASLIAAVGGWPCARPARTTAAARRGG